MKKFKFLKAVLGLAVVVSLILTPINLAFASQLDQSNESGVISDININGHTGVCWQTFKPSLPTLNQATAYLNNGNGDNATLRVVRVSNGTTLFSSVVAVAGDSWYAVTASGDGVAVTPGETLKIVVSTSSATMQWRWGANNYTNGEAYAPDVVADRDFYFRTYGTPASSPTPSASASPTVSASPGSGKVGSAPSETTDSSIKSPTDLKAEDISERDKGKPKIKLTWEASKTSDIEGYHLYGKSDPAADYALVAEVGKEIKEYTDSKVEFDKKYTYMVRANKNDKESESSNEVSITPKKETRELKVFGYLSLGGPLWKQWHFWTLVVLGLAIAGFVIWYVIDRKRAKKSQKITATDSLKS